MAIVLDDTDPVFGGEAQKQGLAKSPAPVTPAPTPLDIYDYQQYSDPYTAVPGSQGYAAPLPNPDIQPYWVNDPIFAGSGGGYTYDPRTGLVWIETQGRWGSLDDLAASNVGMVNDAPYREPLPIERLTTAAYDFVAAPYDYITAQPETVNVENQIFDYIPNYDLQYADELPPGQPTSFTQIDMTPSSRNMPNITTSGGNVWDSTLQTWIDPNGYLRNPVTQEWQTPDEYATYIAGGTPSADWGIVRGAIAAAMAGIGGPYVEPDTTFDSLGPFPGSDILDLPPSSQRVVDLSKISKAVETMRLVEQYRDPSPYQFSAPPAQSGAPSDLPDRANAANVEAYGVDPRDTRYVFSGTNPEAAGLAPGSIPGAWYAVYPNGVQILLKSPTEDVYGVKDAAKAVMTSFVSKSQADTLAKIIVDAAVKTQPTYLPKALIDKTPLPDEAKTGLKASVDTLSIATTGVLGLANLALNTSWGREHAEKIVSNAIQNNASPLGLAGLVIGGPISNVAFELAYSTAQVMLEESPLPEPVKTILELGIGGLAAASTGKLGAAGLSDLPGMTPEAVRLTRTADDLPGLSLKLTDKEKVVSSLQGQSMVEEAVARRGGIAYLPTDIGHGFIRTIDAAKLMNTDGTLRSGVKVVGEVVSEEKPYLLMYDPVTNKTLYVAKEDAISAIRNLGEAEGLTEAVRPTSLKSGDKVLLSDATQGASFGARQSYHVTEDIAAVGPGTRVKIKNEAGDELVVDAGRVWKVGENTTDNTVYFNSGIPFDQLDQSLTKVWGALNRVWVRGLSADTGPRVGVVLHPAGIDNIGKDTPIKEFSKQFDTMIRQLRQTDLPNAVETVSSTYQVYRRDLGRINDGVLLDVPASAREKADGVLHPRLGDVVQNPANYTLTEKQRQAVLNIQGLISQVEAEKRLRGVDEKFLNENNGLGYFPREVDSRRTAVQKGKKGKAKAKLEGLIVEAVSDRRLAIHSRSDRMWDTEHEGAIRGNLVYLKDDVEVFTNWAKESLTSAANKHIKNVADARGVTAAEVIDPKYKMRITQTNKAILSLRERLNTAMKKAGIYKTAEDDLGRVLDDALRLAPDEPTQSLARLPRIIREEKERIEKMLFRPIPDFKTASQSVNDSKRLVTDYISTLKEDIANLERAARESGAEGALYQSAKRTADSLLARAVKVSDKVDDVERRLAPLLEEKEQVKQTVGSAVRGRRRVRVEPTARGATRTSSSLAAARRMVAELNQEIKPLKDDLRKFEKMETRAWSEAEKADLRKAAADAEDMFSKVRYAEVVFRERETIATLRGVVTESVGASLARMMARIDEVLPDGYDRLAKYDDFITRTEKHVRRLSELGGKWADIAADLKQELDSAKAALVRYREVFKNVEEGKQFDLELDGKISLSSAKSGALFNDRRYYEPEVAKVLKKWFEQKRTPPPWLLTTMNQIHVPLITTADFSARWATLRRVQMQLGIMKPGKSIEANVATAREAGDKIRAFLTGTKEYTSKADYLVWRTESRTAFAARYMPFRNETSPGEFIFTHGLGKMPFLKQTQEDFTRTWNRVMVEYFYAQVDALRASGKVLSEADYEAIGRSVGRMGGIPWNRAGDWESSLNFAANFFRSHAELHYYALRKGGIEGNLARQQLATNYFVTSTIVLAFAAWQGRDFAEVINPIDMAALERNEVRLNPNFMTIRLGSGLSPVDMNVAGELRSLYFLMSTLTEGVLMSAAKQDIGYIKDALYYTASTRGQIPLKLIADFSYQHTFDGKSLKDWSGWVQRVTPITFQNIWDNAAEGNISIQNQILAGALAMFGASFTPITDFERRDLYIAQMERFANMSENDKKFYLRDPNRPPSWNNLKTNGKLLVDAEYGKLPVSSWDAKVRARKLGEIDAEYTGKLQNIDNWWKNTKDATTEELKKKLRDAKTEYYYAKDLLYGKYDYKDDNDPVQIYRNKLRELDIPGVGVDFDAAERWLRSQSPEFQREVDAYLGKPLTLTGIGIVDRINANSRALNDLGYYEAQDRFFAQWAAEQGLPAGTTLEAYKIQLIEGDLQAFKDAMVGRPDAAIQIDNKRQELLNDVWENEKLLPWYDYFFEGYMRNFISENPEVALEGKTFEHVSVRKDELAAIRTIGISDVEGLKAEIAKGLNLKAVGELPNEWRESAWGSFALPPELGVTKKETYADTQKAWIAAQFSVASYDELTEAQKKIGTQNWEKLLGDNQDAWYVVERQNRISNFLTLWDNIATDEEKEYIFNTVLSDDRTSWKWMLNKSDAAILYRAAVARNDTKLMKWIEDNAPAAVTYKVNSLTYANLPDAALFPSK